MHRTALILTACLCVSGAITAAPAPMATALESAAVVAPLWLSLAQNTQPESGGAAAAANPAQAEPAAHDPGKAQEIVAGVLTGSLGAVLMLTFLYGRRRRRDHRRPHA